MIRLRKHFLRGCLDFLSRLRYVFVLMISERIEITERKRLGGEMEEKWVGREGGREEEGKEESRKASAGASREGLGFRLFELSRHLAVRIHRLGPQFPQR